MAEQKAFEEWTILELMGHRRLAGLVREQTIGSASFIRIDVFVEGDQAIATQFYNPSAVYCMTPVSEEMARRVARRDQPAPVTRWELPPSTSEPQSGKVEDSGEGYKVIDDDPKNRIGDDELEFEEDIP